MAPALAAPDMVAPGDPMIMSPLGMRFLSWRGVEVNDGR